VRRLPPGMVVAGVCLALASMPVPGPGAALVAQEVPVMRSEAAADLTPAVLRQSEPPITTRAAFIRGFLIPGWGHVGTESYFRGGMFVAAQTSAWWMVWKSMSQRTDARRLRETELSIAEDRLRVQGTVDPDSLSFLAAQDPALEPWDVLLERRGEQVEDWIFLSAFLALLGAVDAFVAAHLWDFPEALALGVGPGPGEFDARNPSVEIRVSVTPEAAERVLRWRRGR
jgi:hypothetical protein